jgi:hypothetical protein
MTLTNEKVREELEAYIADETRKGATMRAAVLKHALRTVGAERSLLEAAALLNPRNRRAVWALPNSEVVLEWPSDLSIEDANDLEEWMALTIRIIKRVAAHRSAQMAAQTQRINDDKPLEENGEPENA